MTAGAGRPPRLTGITDEAAAALGRQIEAATLLGWDSVELRTVDGVALADLDDAAFAAAARRLDEAGLGVLCVDSRIGNWARTVATPFADDLDELDRLVDRCAALGCRQVRVMSYPNAGFPEAAWEREVLRRVRVLAARAAQADVVLLHENCAGWAGTDPRRMLRLVEEGGPALRLLLDLGNGVAYGYQAYELIPALAPYVAHVHVKDGTGDSAAQRWTLPGRGDCRVADSVRLLLDLGYTGAFSIEPHLDVRPHEGAAAAPGDHVDRFVAYARECARLLASVADSRTADGHAADSRSTNGRTADGRAADGTRV